MSSQTESADRLHHLIDDLYAMAVGEVPWTDLSDRLSRLFQSPSAQVQVRSRLGDARLLCVTPNLQTLHREYQEHFYKRDLWVERAARRAHASEVLFGSEVVSDRELINTEFYQDYCRRVGAFHLIGAVYPLEDRSIGVIGLHRTAQDCPFDETERHLMSQVLPHLERSARIWQRLGLAQTQGDLAEALLERSGTGVILVNGNRQVVYANRVADSMLKKESAVRIRQGRLCAAHQADQEQLISMLRCQDPGQARPDSSSILVRNTTGIVALISVAPFRMCLTGIPSAAWMVLIREPETLRLDAAIQASFGLTPAENRVAGALINGKSLLHISREVGSSVATVRKQVKSILSKTGTKRQAECVSLLLRLRAQ